MAKTEFARGALLYNLTEYGITDITIDDSYSEIDVTDTLTAVGNSEYLGGRRSIGVSFSLFKNAGTADLTLNRSGISQTTGTITTGQAYRITTFVAGDDFTNVGAGSNATGVEFIATGTTPTVYTNGSTLTTMLESTITLTDSAANTSTYSGDLVLLTKSIAGTIDDAVKVSYTGRITGSLTETQA